MKRTRTVVITALILLLPTLVAHGVDMRVVLETGGLKTAGPPRVISDQILFSYQVAGDMRDGQIHTVAAAFEHENFSTIHEYLKNDHGVFVLLVPVDPDVDAYRYRLVVNGTWGPDPLAPNQLTDRWGVTLSEYRRDGAGRLGVSYPEVRMAGQVEFRVAAEPGRLVSLVGSFNGWDPFMTPMTEIEPGIYARTIRLTPGEHLYYFMVDGRRFADPRNGNTRWNVDGMIVSAVSLP